MTATSLLQLAPGDPVISPARPRRLPARSTEPPFDDEEGGRGQASLIQGSLALLVAPAGTPAPHRPLHLLPPMPAALENESAPLTAQVAAVIVVRALAEVMSGTRPARQLASWTTGRLQSGLERRHVRGPAAAPLPPCVVRSVRVSEPRTGVAEVTAVIRRGARVGALALRMELHRRRWRVTVLEVG